jgi:hypothetical protein
VKNRFAADAFRRVQNNFALMLQLLLAENGRGWRSFNDDPKRIEAVTAEDIQRVAKQYFPPEARAVITYYTKKGEGSEPTDPALEGLSPGEQAQVRQMRGMIAQMPVDQAKQFLQKLEVDGAQAPPDKQKLIAALKGLLRERIAKGGDL